jgi:hypothetical protein
MLQCKHSRSHGKFHSFLTHACLKHRNRAYPYKTQVLRRCFSCTHTPTISYAHVTLDAPSNLTMQLLERAPNTCTCFHRQTVVFTLFLHIVDTTPLVRPYIYANYFIDTQWLHAHYDLAHASINIHILHFYHCMLSSLSRQSHLNIYPQNRLSADESVQVEACEIPFQKPHAQI